MCVMPCPQGHRRRIRQGNLRRAAGFSLVELAVTVAVLAIIAAIAIPSFERTINTGRLTSAGNELVSAMQTAREEAIARRATATVCPSADGTVCDSAVGNTWLVLLSKNGVDTAMRVVSVPPALSVKVSSNVSSGGNRIMFTPDGFAKAGSNSSGAVSVCTSNMGSDNAIDISVVSVRISSARRSAGSGCSAPADN